MSSVPRSPAPGQAPALDLTNPRAVFVFAVEALEALSKLATVAEDGLRPPTRRKLTKGQARALYRAARATMDALPTVGTTSTPDTAPDSPPRFETWAE